MIIHCPYCGKRHSREFSYEGDASISRPTGDNANDSQAWYDYVYSRKNGISNHQELWHHVNGCRQYMVITRNLRSHEISQVQSMQQFNASQPQQLQAMEANDEPN